LLLAAVGGGVLLFLFFLLPRLTSRAAEGGRAAGAVKSTDAVVAQAQAASLLAADQAHPAAELVQVDKAVTQPSSDAPAAGAALPDAPARELTAREKLAAWNAATPVKDPEPGAPAFQGPKLKTQKANGGAAPEVPPKRARAKKRSVGGQRAVGANQAAGKVVREKKKFPPSLAPREPRQRKAKQGG